MSFYRVKKVLMPACMAVVSFVCAGTPPALAQVKASDALVKAARAEGGLTIYSSSSEGLTKALVAAFEKEYGIPGTFLRLAQTPLEQRFATEFDAKRNQADIFSVSSPVPYDTHPQWFVPLGKEAVPSIATWPARWLAKNHVIWATDVVVVHYNTDQSSGAPVKKWSEVIDPKWKGRILLTDLRVADNYMGWLDGMEKRFGMDFLRKIAAQDVKVTQSGASGVQMVAAGAYQMNFPTFSDFATQLIAKKAPVATQQMTDPMFVSVRAIGISSGAPHPNAARLYLNWLLSPEGIRLTCRISTVTVAGDLDGKLGCTPVKNPVLVNYIVAPERQQELLRAIGIVGR